MKLMLVGTGTRPLLMHNVRLASPLNAFARELKRLNATPSKSKTDEIRLQMARVEFEGGMYYSDELGPVVPGINLLASLTAGARIDRLGKKVERGVIVHDLEIPLLYDGPRDLDGLWGDGLSDYVDIRPVTVMRSKVDRCRPYFPKWAFEALVEIDTEVIEREEFVRIAEKAGELEGLGDFRRMFGRFSAEVRDIS